MSDEIKKLNELSGFLKRANKKIKLLRLLDEAKNAYDSFDFEQGKTVLEKALLLEPESPAVLRGLGFFAQNEGLFDDAILYYKKALNNSDKKEIEYTLIGTAYYLSENLDDAIKYFNLAIDENEDYTQAYEGRNQAMLENHLKIVDLQETLKKYF